MNEDLIKNLYLGHHKEKTLKHAYSDLRDKLGKEKPRNE